MKLNTIKVNWPNGKETYVKEGDGWLEAAEHAGINIPLGCLGGSCGACEIEVNGKILRACISKIEKEKHTKLDVEFATDPYW
tara:strand:- start:34568 stop:34813 length:246 start_codon:yes stop_codon:yes gene_type:complete